MTHQINENKVTLPNGLKMHYYEWAGDGPNLIFLHPSSSYGRMTEAVKSVLASSQRTLTAPSEFVSREAALEFLRSSRPRDSEKALLHRVEQNYVDMPDGRVALHCDNVRVALGLAHMADNLRPYAARVTCPVAFLRGGSGAELTREQAESMAKFWPNAQIIDVEGDYALQMENPAGLAQALVDFVGQTARV